MNESQKSQALDMILHLQSQLNKQAELTQVYQKTISAVAQVLGAPENVTLDGLIELINEKLTK